MMGDINSFKEWLEKKAKEADEKSRAKQTSSRPYCRGERDAYREMLAQLMIGDVHLIRLKWEEGKPRLIPTDWDFTEEDNS